MPIVKSHQKPLYEAGPERKNDDMCFEDIDCIVCGIAKNILSESPQLIAGAYGARTGGPGDVRQYGSLEDCIRTDGIGPSSVRLNSVLPGGTRPDGLHSLESAIISDIDSHRYRYGIFKDELVRKVLRFLLSYGELQRYVDDEDVTDIVGTRYNQFLVKRRGAWSKIPVNLGGKEIFETCCRLAVVRNGGILNEYKSCFRVADEKYRLRINVFTSPGSISGPAISIRKHRLKSFGLEDLMGLGMLNGELVSLLKRLAAGDESVIFCGKAAAGKTTLMRAFINALPEMERVFIAESDAELYPDKPCCIWQSTVKLNSYGSPAALRDLVREGGTMSMDTYCVGDIAGDEALEFIKLMYSGHRGIASMYSDSAANALDRICAFCTGCHPGGNEKTIREMLGESIDVVLYLEDFKVVEVLEMNGFDRARNAFEYKKLYPHED